MQAGGDAIVIPCNIARKAEVEALIAGTIKHYGKIDILVCNAAVNPYYGPLLDITDEAFDKIMGSNVKSNIWLSALAIPQMAERGNGSVVIISSIGGLRGSTVIGAYGISKAADFALCRSLAGEWGPKGVRVNCIAPGLVKTDFARALWEDEAMLKRRTATDAARAASASPTRSPARWPISPPMPRRFMTGQTIVDRRRRDHGGGVVVRPAMAAARVAGARPARLMRLRDDQGGSLVEMHAVGPAQLAPRRIERRATARRSGKASWTIALGCPGRGACPRSPRAKGTWIRKTRGRRAACDVVDELPDASHIRARRQRSGRLRSSAPPRGRDSTLLSNVLGRLAEQAIPLRRAPGRDSAWRDSTFIGCNRRAHRAQTAAPSAPAPRINLRSARRRRARQNVRLDQDDLRQARPASRRSPGLVTGEPPAQREIADAGTRRCSSLRR